MNKPNGQFLIHPTQVDDFTANLEIKKFFGIGKVTAEKLGNMGLHHGRDLRKYSRHELIALFGKSGKYYYNICRGIDERPVKPNRIRKSVGAERTFSSDLAELNDQLDALKKIAEEVASRMQKGKHRGRTITVKLRYSDFTTHTRSRSLEDYTAKTSQIFEVAQDLLRNHPREQALRLLGISISNLDTEKPENHGQLTLDF
jgi:DNA polymerase-4